MAITRRDEVLGKAVASDDAVIPRYRLVAEDGRVVAEHVELQLENPVLQEGMAYNKDFANEVLAASGTTAGELPGLVLAQEGYELAEGATVRAKLHVTIPAGSSGVTLDVGGSGAVAMVTGDGSEVLPQMAQGEVMTLVYTGSHYCLQGVQALALAAGAVNSRVVVANPDTAPDTWGVDTSPGAATPVFVPAAASPTGNSLVGFILYRPDGVSGAELTLTSFAGLAVTRYWGGASWAAWVYGAAGTAAGVANAATKLATARTIQTNLASTAAASFNGSANVSPGVSGTLGRGNGGTGATNGISASYVQAGTFPGSVVFATTDLSGWYGRNILFRNSAGANVASCRMFMNRK